MCASPCPPLVLMLCTMCSMLSQQAEAEEEASEVAERHEALNQQIAEWQTKKVTLARLCLLPLV